MQKFTIHDIIKILPLDESLKKELIDNYDTYDDAKKYRVQKVCWSAFHEYKRKLEELKTQEFLIEIEQGKRKMARLRADVLEAVWQYFESVLSGKVKEVEQIDEIRNKLQELTSTLNPKTAQ